MGALLKAVVVPVTPFEQNCTLLWERESRAGAVIDPGGDAPKILAQVREHKIEVQSIILTHGHLDHAGGTAALQRALTSNGQAPPILGPDPRDLFLLDGIAQQARAYGLSGMDNARPDRWLAEGDRITIGGVAFDVLHCPGHTPGHLIYVARSLNMAVVGDVLFAGSVGRTDFPYGDHAALMASIHDKVLPLGDDVRVLCGHGPSTTIGYERRTNPFLVNRS
jgi:glyoxylase-like metal-dependent hydrolase (beta-lactamase superfamily II)